MFPKSIKEHPIWSKVIASVITAGVLYFASLIPGFYLAIWSGIKYSGAWLIATIPIPYWLLILLFFAAVIVIGKVALRLFTSPGALKTEYDYTQDQFWDIVWRWRYNRNDICQVVSFCPKCDMQIYPEREYGDMIYNKPDGSRFTCDHCGQFNKVVPIHPNNIENSVVRKIQRKLRTEEWRDSLAEKLDTSITH